MNRRTWKLGLNVKLDPPHCSAVPLMSKVMFQQLHPSSYRTMLASRVRQENVPEVLRTLINILDRTVNNSFHR